MTTMLIHTFFLLYMQVTLMLFSVDWKNQIYYHVSTKHNYFLRNPAPTNSWISEHQYGKIQLL